MKLNPLHKAMLEAGAEIISREFKKGLSDLLPDLKEVKDTYAKTKDSVDREAIAKELHAYIDKLKVSKKGDTLLTIATLLRNFIKEVDAEPAPQNQDEVRLSNKTVGGLDYRVYTFQEASVEDGAFVFRFDVDSRNFLDAMLENPNLLVTIERNSLSPEPDPINVTVALRMMDNDLGFTKTEDRHYITLTVPLTSKNNFTKHMTK